MGNFLYKLAHNKLIDIYALPINKWFKARKDFIPPKIKFYKFRNDSDFYLSSLMYQEDAIININDFEWKSKYGDYRFEWLPYILIKIGNWRLLWTFEAPDGDNTHYYELILNYLYKYDKDYDKTIKNYGWSTWVDGKWAPVIKDYKRK